MGVVCSIIHLIFPRVHETGRDRQERRLRYRPRLVFLYMMPIPLPYLPGKQGVGRLFYSGETRVYPIYSEISHSRGSLLLRPEPIHPYGTCTCESLTALYAPLISSRLHTHHHESISRPLCLLELCARCPSCNHIPNDPPILLDNTTQFQRQRARRRLGLNPAMDEDAPKATSAYSSPPT